LRDKRHYIKFDWQNEIHSEVIEDNLQLSELTPDALKKALVRAAGKSAYYASIRADAKELKAKRETAFEIWMAQKIAKIDPSTAKQLTSEKSRVNEVILTNLSDYKKWKDELRRIDLILDKTLVLINAFKDMGGNLQSVNSTMREELKNSRGGYASGTGNLEDADYD